MTDRYRCIGNDKVHKSDYFVKVYTAQTGGAPGVTQAVSWCQECGAVAVDNFQDGRRMTAVTKLRFPNRVTLDNKAEESEDKTAEPKNKE